MAAHSDEMIAVPIDAKANLVNPTQISGIDELIERRYASDSALKCMRYLMIALGMTTDEAAREPEYTHEHPVDLEAIEWFLVAFDREIQ